jgi:tRNA-dihydrouridine synthase A
MITYAGQQARDFGTPLKSITRHMMGLYQGLPGARIWRRTLSTLPYAEIIEKALQAQKDSPRPLPCAA